MTSPATTFSVETPKLNWLFNCTALTKAPLNTNKKNEQTTSEATKALAVMDDG